MKKLFICSCALLGSISLFAQQGNVGINTVTPRVKLDVNGSYKSSKLITGTVPQITSTEKDRYLLLNQSTVDNRVRKIDPTQPSSPGLASIITYKLSNVDLDWVESFNTKINSQDYSVMVLSAYFDRDVTGTETAIPSYGVKSVNNEWILYADYSEVAAANNGTWTLVCAIYPKTYVKIFPERGPFNVNSTSSGSDNNPILQ